MQERFLDSPRRLRYLIGGDGPPMLLCHGFLGSAENFTTWFEAMGRRRTLVIPDLPGCGQTPSLTGQHTCGALARSVEPLIHELGLESFDLGGLCLGAGVACELLARFPDRVGRLILHTPLLDPSVVRDRFHLQVAVMTSAPVFPAISWLSRRRVVSDLYKRWMVEGSDVDPDHAEANFRNQLLASHRAQREWLLSGLRRRDADLLAGHAGESLVIVAGNDRILEHTVLKRLVRPMARVRYACLEEAGHGWSADFVRRQLDLLDAFLDGRSLPRVTVAA